MCVGIVGKPAVEMALDGVCGYSEWDPGNKEGECGAGQRCDRELLESWDNW